MSGRDGEVHLSGPRRQPELRGFKRRDGKSLADRRAIALSKRRHQTFATPVRLDTRYRPVLSGPHRGLSSNHAPSVMALQVPSLVGTTYNDDVEAYKRFKPRRYVPPPPPAATGTGTFTDATSPRRFASGDHVRNGAAV